MLVDAHDLADGTVLSASVCVVGAGAAGITLAHALRGSGLSVCLLEGGGREPEADSNDLYAGQETGPLRIRLASCRERALGGTTRRWAGWCYPLEAADFEAAHDLVGGHGWPLDAQALAPYVARARDTLEIGVDEPVEALAQRAGRPLLPLDPARVRTVLYQYSTPPTALHERYGPALEAAAADDVTVYLHANAVSLEAAPGGAAIGRLHVATLAGTRLRVEAERYVLAMGGIETPRLLLASGLASASGRLGRGFMEHPHYMGDAHLLLRDEVDLSLYTRRWTVTTRDAAHPEGVDVEIQAALALPAARRRDEGLVTMAGTLFDASSDRAVTGRGGVEADALEGLWRGGSGGLRLYGMDLRSEQRPLADSTVTLGDERDALGVPRVRVHWTVDPADVADAGRTLAWIGAELGRTGLGRLWMPTDGAGSFTPRRIVGGCHHMGTTRMSAAPSEGVVDADGRVHGLSNLYVAGSAVFPTGGFANPTLTIVALAHRMADHLRHRAAGSP